MQWSERPHILSLSYDRMLLMSRQSVLESRGYRVTSAEGFEQGLAACRNADYDLLLIGHSVPPADKQAIIEASKQHSQSPILALLRPGESEVSGASKSIDASYLPDALLLVVDELLAR